MNREDYQNIFDTIDHYIRGARTGLSIEMSRAFHPDATIFGYDESGLFAGPIQKLFDWNDANGPAVNIQARIEHVEIVETVATVRLEIEDWTGHRFTDLFTLMKVDGIWKIINKVFHQHNV